MQFERPLIPATLVRRYKRFLADVCLEDGSVATVHCPNTGSMLGCDAAGARVWLSVSDNPRRKYAMTWELVEVEGSVLVGINTGLPNRLVAEAVAAGMLPELGGIEGAQTEVKFGRERSRVDLLLSGRQGKTFVEVKNVTASVREHRALFPDAVTQRGTRHLRELMGVIDEGHRAALVFCVQRGDVRRVEPADEIDTE